MDVIIILRELFAFAASGTNRSGNGCEPFCRQLVHLRQSELIGHSLNVSKTMTFQQDRRKVLKVVGASNTLLANKLFVQVVNRFSDCMP